MMSQRAKLRQAYTERFVESLAAGLVVEDVVLALADACKRAIENEVPPSTKVRAERIRFLARCAVALDEAAKKVRA